MRWNLVTGAAKGLGAEICHTLAEQGYPLLVHYRSSAGEAQHVVEACRRKGVAAEKIQGDFSSMQSTLQFIEDLKKQFPDVKNLINNVGNYLVKSALETTDEEWVQIFQTNLNAPFALARGFLPSIKLARGSIINIGTAGINAMRANTASTAYTLSKQALLMLTKSLAKELAPNFVRVNMVSPGHLEHSVDLPKDKTKLPMQRPATRQEAAQVIAFLLKEESQYITGQNIEVAGGFLL